MSESQYDWDSVFDDTLPNGVSSVASDGAGQVTLVYEAYEFQISADWNGYLSVTLVAGDVLGLEGLMGKIRAKISLRSVWNQFEISPRLV